MVGMDESVPLYPHNNNVTSNSMANGAQAPKPTDRRSAIIFGSVFGGLMALLIIAFVIKFILVKRAEKKKKAPPILPVAKDIETGSTTSEESMSAYEHHNAPVTTTVTASK